MTEHVHDSLLMTIIKANQILVHDITYEMFIEAEGKKDLCLISANRRQIPHLP